MAQNVSARELAALSRIRRDPEAKVERTLLTALMNKELVQVATLGGKRKIALREKGRKALEMRDK